MKQIPNMQKIDSRQPRFSAVITSIVALSAVIFGILGYPIIATSLYAYSTLIFAWSVSSSRSWHPYKAIFKILSKRMSPPPYMEDPRGPFFAQKVGLIVSSLAFTGSLFSPTLGVVFGGMLFLASSLNAYFNVCLGCIIYLRLKKLGINL